MRVGVYISEVQEKHGGASTFQTTILSALSRVESEHLFYIFYEGREDLFKDRKNVKFINLVFFENKKNEFYRSPLNKKILENKIELVWFPTPICEFIEAPFVLTVWDLQHRLQPYFPEVSFSGWKFDEREGFYRSSISRASYVITGNNEGAKQVEKFYGFPIDRIKTIPLPVPEFVVEKNYDDSILLKNEITKNSYLFYPAQFWPHKNHIRIIKALSILKNQKSSLKVVFTGSDMGNVKYIHQKVMEYNLKSDIKFLGFVSKSELISLYKNAFAMVFPSMFGPDNLPPLEAMALNCPVICSDAAGMKEQLGDSALFFKSTDENDLAEKIQRLVNDQNLRESLIISGNELASKLTPDNYIQKFIDIVDEFVPIRECWSSEQKYIHLA